MSNYKKFRIEAWHDDTRFKVQVKGWFGWESGYAWTNYFALSYNSHKEAVDAVEGYKNRFTELE